MESGKLIVYYMDMFFLNFSFISGLEDKNLGLIFVFYVNFNEQFLSFNR